MGRFSLGKFVWVVVDEYSETTTAQPFLLYISPSRGRGKSAYRVLLRTNAQCFHMHIHTFDTGTNSPYLMKTIHTTHH